MFLFYARKANLSFFYAGTIKQGLLIVGVHSCYVLYSLSPRCTSSIRNGTLYTAKDAPILFSKTSSVSLNLVRTEINVALPPPNYILVSRIAKVNSQGTGLVVGLLNGTLSVYWSGSWVHGHQIGSAVWEHAKMETPPPETKSTKDNA